MTERIPVRLAPLDQAAASGTRATGRNSLIQVAWIYDAGVAPQELEQFRVALANGLLGRRLRRSSLPFGPDRWVRSTSAPKLDVATPRPRAGVEAWFAERLQVPIDPWNGPGWHLALLPLDDGGAAVTLVLSHLIADGVGAATAVAEAAMHTTRDLPYSPAPSGRARLVALDAVETARLLPTAARASRAAFVLARARLHPTAPDPREPSPDAPIRDAVAWAGPVGIGPGTVGPDQAVVLYLDRTATTARAAELGGSESTLLFVVAARIAAELGWTRPDGAAVLGVSVDQRTDADLRANAIIDAELAVDPTTTDLESVRADLKRALIALPTTGQRYHEFAPLAPLLPRGPAADLIEAPVDPALPITTCAAIGLLPEPVRSPTGAGADRVSFRLGWSALPGRTPVPRTGYLYLGWMGTQAETALFVATNLPAAARRGVRAVAEQACASLGIPPPAP